MSALDDAGAPIGCGCAVIAVSAAVCLWMITDWLIEHGERILALLEAGAAP